MILIIDDDREFALGLERFLRFTGLDTVAVNSGTEALAMLHAGKPALIILDLHLPLMNGMTILRAVRKDPNFRNVPILVLTSDITRDKEIEAINAGAQAFLVKGTLGWPSLL